MAFGKRKRIMGPKRNGFKKRRSVRKKRTSRSTAANYTSFNTKVLVVVLEVRRLRFVLIESIFGIIVVYYTFPEHSCCYWNSDYSCVYDVWFHYRE